MSSQVSVQEALIYAMVTMSAIDGIISERESRKIRSLVTQLPVFAGFDPARIAEVADACGQRAGAASPDGLRAERGCRRR
jgi:tellurite resistance protein